DRRQWPSVGVLKFVGELVDAALVPAPSKSVERKVSTQALAISTPIRRAPSAIALASLWRRARLADSGSSTCAQRQAELRFAAMATPMPDPQTVIPRSARPSASASASIAPNFG